MHGKEEKLSNISISVRQCVKCGLCKTAQNAVPGEGSANSELVFIGEAPGANEDKTGRPFVGRAGKLLEAGLAYLGYQRKDVWIGNIIKHRPPKNRDPLPEEIKACVPYLTRQLAVIQPKLIVTLGRFAMRYFYADGKISRDRGNLIRVGTYNVYPIYHPAAALRNGTMMKAFKEDFRRIPEILEGIRSGKLPAVNCNSFLETGGAKVPSEKVPNGQLGLEI